MRGRRECREIVPSRDVQEVGPLGVGNKEWLPILIHGRVKQLAVLVGDRIWPAPNLGQLLKGDPGNSRFDTHDPLVKNGEIKRPEFVGIPRGPRGKRIRSTRRWLGTVGKIGQVVAAAIFGKDDFLRGIQPSGFERVSDVRPLRREPEESHLL